MIALGSKAKDKITGFSGIVTGHARYITGCDQYLLNAKATSDGQVHSLWVDENRLEVAKDKPICIYKGSGPSGGPAMNPAPVK